MNYIINPIWFYWLQIVVGVRTILWVIFAISVWLIIICFVGYAINVDCSGFDDKDSKRYLKWIEKAVFIAVISAIIVIMVPSKDTLIEMQIAKYATIENANWTLETIKSAVDYIIEAIKNMK